MKILCLSILLALTSCGGVGTEPTSEKAKGSPDEASGGTKIEQELLKNNGCTEEVKSLIETVAELCAANMTVDVNRTLCLIEARGLRSQHPNFVCTLDGGELVDSDYIQENFITKIETEKDKLKKSGIFDD